MAEDTFTMEDIDEINLEEAPEKPKAEKPKAEKPEKEIKEGEPEGITSFADAFSKALDGDQVDIEPEKVEEEPEKAEEKAVEEVAESRSSSDFKKVKEDRDNARRELGELKSKLADLENSDVDGIMEQLKTERDDLSQRLKLAAIERHPKFQKEFQSKVDGITEQAKRVVGADSADRVAELLQQADSEYRANALEEIMLELSTTKQAQLGSLLTRMAVSYTHLTLPTKA